VVACGALSVHVQEIADRKGWPVDVYPLPPLLHNHPERIAEAVERQVLALRDRYGAIAVAYADCGSYGALDEVCERYRLPHLGGSHCYDVFAGQQELKAIFEAEPGTYVLTDYLARSFRRSVVVELGLDRHPELLADYFGNYRRVVWLAQRQTADLTAAARDAADFLGLPLEVVPTGDAGLERELASMLATVLPT
jgi:Protein of unknown function (DUF1638)